MSDLISRQAAIDAVKERITFEKSIRLFVSDNADLEKAISNIRNLPSAEKTGEWVHKSVIEEIKAELQGYSESLRYRYNDYEDGKIEAYEDAIDCINRHCS